VKAFDTVNHELLFQMLLRYGLPPGLVQKIKRLYSNCKVKIRVGTETIELHYTTGVHQGDNMSPVLFLFIMQAFLDTLHFKTQNIQFSYFPKNKNGNLQTSKGRLLGQNTKAQGSPFIFNSSLYIDDSFFCFQTRQELHQATIKLNAHFAHFGLTMHVGSNASKSKSGAMFFPASLKQAKQEVAVNVLPEDLTLPGGQTVHFVHKFKYLWSIITPLLNEDAEVKARIKKTKSLLGAAKSFFDNKDVDKRIKSHIYVAGSLNALLWGCKTWNLTKQNLSKLTSFHHSAIHRILAISWKQVREKHIKNKEVRGML